MTESIPMVAAPPGDPLEALLREVESRAHAKGWDAPSSYHMLEANPLGVMIWGDDLPESLGHAYPPMLLTTMAEHYLRGLKEGVPLPLSPAFIGWAATWEGWMVSAHKDDVEGEARNIADAGARRLHERADRRETRIAMVVLAKGDEASLHRVRGVADQPDELRFTRTPMDGEVPAALRRLVAACALCVLATGSPKGAEHG